MRAVGVGAGGHAKVVLESIQEQSDVEVVGLLDADPDMKGKEVLGVRVLGGDELLAKLFSDGVHHAFIGVGGVGDNMPRRKVFELLKKHGFSLLSPVHSSSVVSPSASLGEAACLCSGSIVAAGATIGSNVIVNSGAIVEHDCVVHDHVHVASGAVLAGGVVVGEGAHVGAGATVKQGIRIGRDAIVAMGAAVIEDVPDGSAVGGVPARPLGASVKR
jgi:sugar O-acyltransferase (sialic acid O-acetyltransferase NeuD family)